ncbi:MAG: protein-L-isoaspartate O-methyltransferase [Pseudomonadota bacterium]
MMQATTLTESAKLTTHPETARFNADRETARFNMIEQQVRTWEVLDPVVLSLLNAIPRENFVAAEYQGLAFADIEIPIGANQLMLSPKLEGRILQALNVKKTHQVLQIGTGSGYMTALLASLAKHVISVDIHAELSAKAAENLTKNNIQNVTLQVADAALGLPDKAPFDLIVYTASSPIEPAGVRNQLAVGGVMFIVLGTSPAMQATLIQRISQTGFRQDVLFETCIAELVNAPKAKAFEF